MFCGRAVVLLGRRHRPEQPFNANVLLDDAIRQLNPDSRKCEGHHRLKVEAAIKARLNKGKSTYLTQILPV
jgi:hypothetical protein